MGFNCGLWAPDCGQSYLAMLIMPQNCTKMVRNLTFLVQFADIFLHQTKGREQQKRKFCFLEKPLLEKATFDSFLASFEQHFENKREYF